MKTVTLYTDGACSGNPGPGGWGVILEYHGIEKGPMPLPRCRRKACL